MDQTDDPSELVELATRQAFLVKEHGVLLRDVGLVSPEAFAADARVRHEWVAALTGTVRRYLEDEGSDQAVVGGSWIGFWKRPEWRSFV